MPSVKRPKRKRDRTYFREWREHCGLKQYEAAARLEIEPSTLSRLESGQSPYDQDILERMALAYGCGTDDLLSYNPLQPDPPRLVYSALRKVPPEMQRQAWNVIEALLKAS